MDFIDVWNVDSYPADAVALLQAQAEVIASYIATENEIFREYDRGRRKSRPLFRPSNPFYDEHAALTCEVDHALRPHSIRGFHYTRLTDGEVARMRSDGIILSDPDFLRQRLTCAVSDGLISSEVAGLLFDGSPLMKGQHANRAGMFWLVSHPQEVNDGGVTSLLGHWGGEVTYMYVKDRDLISALRGIGQPRIVEVIAPLEATGHVFRAAEAVMKAFAVSLGCVARETGFDFHLVEPAGPESILAIHTLGEPEFDNMGASYPTAFPGEDPDYWFKLTGER